MAGRWLSARLSWHYGGLCGTQESDGSSWLEEGDVESQVGVGRKEEDQGDDQR